MRAWLHIVTFLICLVQLGSLRAQETQNRLAFGGTYRAGYLIPIFEGYPASSLVSAVDFTLTSTYASEKSQFSMRKDCRWMITASLLDFGNPEILGQGFSLFPSTEHTLFSNEKSQLTWTIGLGLSYFNRPFDPIKNPENEVIGSSITAVFNTDINYHRKLSGKIDMILGLGVRHFSNGHFTVPNIGANIVGGHFGIKGISGSLEPHLEKTATSGVIYQAFAGIGWHEAEGTTEPKGGPLYRVHSIGLSMGKWQTNTRQLSFLLLVSQDEAAEKLIIHHQLFKENAWLNANKVSLLGGYSWYFGNLDFTGHGGVNLFYPFRPVAKESGLVRSTALHDWVTTRIAFNYSLLNPYTNRHVPYIGFGLRTIGFHADFIELTLGIKIGRPLIDK